VEFRILGPLEAWEDGSPVALGGAKQRALLAVLLLYANEVVSTERLIDLLWEEPPAKATKAVQVYASRLRKALGGRMPTSRPPGYLLALSPEQLDLARFRRLREEARRDPTGAPEKLEEALALWRGQALAEFAGEPFAQVERGRLEEERLGALEEWIEAGLALGRHTALVGELEALVATHPLRERPRRQLMLALYRCGRQAEALAAYREARRLLVEELGIEPGRALQQLEQGILRQDAALELVPSVAPAPAPAPARLPPSDETSLPPPGVREERKVVSVLFVELVGRARRAEPADPEDVRAVLRRFHEVVRQEIERFGGTIESVAGDALMAVFGTPAHEDDPERAVRAALAIRGSAGESDEELQVRMSVDTGMALVSLDARPEGEPITAGDVVTNARRLQVAAPVNGILVGEPTHRATLETIDYRATAPIEARGKSETIPAWEAVSAGPRRGIDLLREPRTPLVGRERELALLVSALDRVVEERSPQLITLVGVPGIGKSRLAFELSKTLDQDREQITWLQGRCLSYGDGVSFWALGEIVKAQAGILESDSPEQAEEKLRGAVAVVLTVEDEAAWVERELRPLVGAGGGLRQGVRSEEGFAAWRRFLDGLAEQRPLVLVLEDLHWADEGLLEFVDELAARLRDAPLLVLCTARPELLERRPGWGGGKANALTISLAPLSEEETERLVSSVLGQPLLDAELQELLLARTAGNPLYAEQFARMFTEIGSLEEVPETVHGMIAARLDGLLPQEKALLQDAAVVGKVFWSGAIESIGEVTRRQVEELLFALERKEFVQPARRSSVAGNSEYAFRHVLLRDVAYAQIPRAARADKHRRAALWIESLGRPDDHAEMLAHHYSSALEYARGAGREDPALAERARLALRAAGDRAFAVASYASAAHFYGAALELWPDDDPDRVWLLVHAGHARHVADGTGINLLEQGFEELCSGGNREDAAEVAVEVARRSWLVGDRDAAYTYIDRALELVEGRGDSRARAYALVERAAYHMSATEHPQAIRLVREALPLTEALGMDDLHVRALDVLGSSRASLGDVKGLDDTKKAIALARDRNAFYRLIVAELNLQGILVFLGQVAAASEALRAYRHDVERYGTADQRNWLRATEAHDAVFEGRWEEASRILDERLAEAEAGATHYSDPSCRALRASIALARGDLEAASADSEQALARARRTKDPQLLAPTLALRAIVELAQGRREEASRRALEVLAQGSVLVSALLELHPTVTPIELAWLIRDLGREAELLAALESAPSTPWHEAARAIADGDVVHSVELVARIGAPSVDAYARLRAAEELTRLGRLAGVHDILEPALVFFRKVGATRYLAQAEQLLAA
jgi:DNA-binding SARP family transcriptional activator/tetratricopeptide (TPR) repeat protein